MRKGRRRHPARSFANPLAPNFLTPAALRAHPPPPARRFIPELTAGSPAEPDNEKQVQEAKTGLRATHLSLYHLDLDFAGVEDARSEEPSFLGRQTLRFWRCQRCSTRTPRPGTGPCGH